MTNNKNQPPIPFFCMYIKVSEKNILSQTKAYHSHGYQSPFQFVKIYFLYLFKNLDKLKTFWRIKFTILFKIPTPWARFNLAKLIFYFAKHLILVILFKILGAKKCGNEGICGGEKGVQTALRTLFSWCSLYARGVVRSTRDRLFPPFEFNVITLSLRVRQAKQAQDFPYVTYRIELTQPGLLFYSRRKIIFFFSSWCYFFYSRSNNECWQINRWKFYINIYLSFWYKATEDH